MNSRRPLVLLTGASTGLGLALARELIKEGNYRLVLTARERSMSRFAAHGIFETENVHIRPLDVTSDAQRRAIVSECESRFGGIDILINNAGVALRSVAEDASPSDRRRILEVNYIGPMRLTSLALPGMRRRAEGRVINISSAAGIIGMPTMGAYCSSKFALEGGTESLWYEVRPWNIKVSLVIPGFIRSDSFRNTKTTQWSQRAINSNGRDPYWEIYLCMSCLIESLMGAVFATPESVARRVMKTLKAKRPPLRVLATLDAWMLYMARRFLPMALHNWMVMWAIPKGRRLIKTDPVDLPLIRETKALVPINMESVMDR